MPNTARIDLITEQATRRIPALLSTLWLFVLLTVIFRDIHELFRQGFLEEIMSGAVNGVEMTETTLLIAGIALGLPLAMVVLARLLPRRLNRWLNAAVAIATFASFLANGINDLDDYWFLGLATLGLGAIVYMSLAWRVDPARPS